MRTGSIWTTIKNQIRYTGVAGKLILVNLGVFLLLGIIFLIAKSSDNPGLYFSTTELFIAPTDLADLGSRPWTALTNIFTHTDFGHFFFNMLGLFFISRLFVAFFGDRRLLLTYFLGGIFAYFFHVLATHLFIPEPLGGYPGILGASGSVMAIFFAAAVYRPKQQVLFFGAFPVPLIGLAGLFLLLDLVGLGSSGEGNNVAHFAHLGGAAFGALSVIKADSPKNFMNRLDRWFFQFKMKLSKSSFKKRKPRMKVHKNKKPVSQMTDVEYNARKNANQERIDAILEKISKKGYNGLTKEEKEILFNESKR